MGPVHSHTGYALVGLPRGPKTGMCMGQSDLQGRGSKQGPGPQERPAKSH